MPGATCPALHTMGELTPNMHVVTAALWALASTTAAFTTCKYPTPSPSPNSLPPPQTLMYNVFLVARTFRAPVWQEQNMHVFESSPPGSQDQSWG